MINKNPNVVKGFDVVGKCGSIDTLILQIISSAVGYPSESEGKKLLLKTPHTWVIKKKLKTLNYHLPKSFPFYE